MASKHTITKKRALLTVGVLAILVGSYFLWQFIITNLLTNAVAGFFDKSKSIELCATTKEFAYDFEAHVSDQFKTSEVTYACTGTASDMVTNDSATIRLTSTDTFDTSDEIRQAITEMLTRDNWNIADAGFSKDSYGATVAIQSIAPAMAIVTLQNTAPSTELRAPERTLTKKALSPEARLPYLGFSAYQPSYNPANTKEPWSAVFVSDDYERAEYTLVLNQYNEFTKQHDSITLTSSALPDTITDTNPGCIAQSGVAKDCRAITKTVDGTELYATWSEEKNRFSGSRIYGNVDETLVTLTGYDLNDSYDTGTIRAYFESLKAANSPARTH